MDGDITITRIAISVFSIVTVPVFIGLCVRHFATNFTDRFAEASRKISAGLFILVLLGAIFQERNHPAFSRPEIQREITYEKGDLPRSEKPRQDMMTIPAFPVANEALLDQYIKAFHKVTANATELLE